MSTEPPTGPPGPWSGQPGQDRFAPPPPSAPPGPPRPPGPPDPPNAGPPNAEPPGASRLPDDTRPQPGELHLQGRRSWKTWQFLVGLLIAAVIGMAINGAASGSAAPSSGSGSGSSGGSYKLPTESSGSSGSGSSGSSGTTGSSGTSRSTGGRSASSTTTTTVAGGAGGTTTTTVAGNTGAGAGTGGGSTATTQPLGQEAYLVPAHQGTGNWTSPAFNIAGSTWYLGWAFQCNPVPAATPKFAVYVVPNGASPSGSTPAVTQSGASGQNVTNLTSTGSQQLVVQAPPQCEWIVKVTGYGG